jgi:hypothetical protein
MRVFAAQVDRKLGSEDDRLVVVEFDATFSKKTMTVPGSRGYIPTVPNHYRDREPYSEAEVTAGVMSTGQFSRIAFATTREQAIKTLCAALESDLAKAEQAAALARNRLRVAQMEVTT